MELAFSGEQKVKKGPTKKWSQGEIEAEIRKIEAKIQDARENQGEIEVRDLILDKAEFYRYEAEDFEQAEEIFREAYKLTGGASKKMEILFECLLMSIDKEDTQSIKKDITECHKLIDDGADWIVAADHLALNATRLHGVSQHTHEALELRLQLSMVTQSMYTDIWLYCM